MRGESLQASSHRERRGFTATWHTEMVLKRALMSVSLLSPVVFVCADEGSEVESEMDEDLDDSSEPQAKREKTELSQAFPVGCMQPVLESGVQPSLLNPLHSEHIVTSPQTIRQCSATGNTYTAV